MWKRIVIGLLILSAIGTAVFFVLQPEKGTEEYHKRAYHRAQDRLLMSDCRSQLAHWVRDKTGVTPRFLYPSAKERERLLGEIEGPVDALVRTGALSVNELVVKEVEGPRE